MDNETEHNSSSFWKKKAESHFILLEVIDRHNRLYPFCRNDCPPPVYNENVVMMLLRLVQAVQNQFSLLTRIGFDEKFKTIDQVKSPMLYAFVCELEKKGTGAEFYIKDIIATLFYLANKSEMLSPAHDLVDISQVDRDFVQRCRNIPFVQRKQNNQDPADILAKIATVLLFIDLAKALIIETPADVLANGINFKIREQFLNFSSNHERDVITLVLNNAINYCAGNSSAQNTLMINVTNISTTVNELARRSEQQVPSYYLLNNYLLPLLRVTLRWSIKVPTSLFFDEIVDPLLHSYLRKSKPAAAAIDAQLEDFKARVVEKIEKMSDDHSTLADAEVILTSLFYPTQQMFDLRCSKEPSQADDEFEDTHSFKK